MFDYKENNVSFSRADMFFCMDPMIQTCSKTINDKIKEDIKTILTDITNFNIANFTSYEFILAISNIKKITKYCYFEEYEFLTNSDFFNILFSIAFPNPGKECDFFQSQALKIISNFVNCPIKLYVNHFVQMDVIPKTNSVLTSNSDAVVNNAIKLLISIAPADISYTQDILTFVKVGKLIELSEKFHDYSSIEHNIVRLVYYLSRCDTNSEINDFIDFMSFQINKIKTNVKENHTIGSYDGILITILITSSNLMTNFETASLFHKFQLFIELLNFSLKFNYDDDTKDNYVVLLPALKSIDFMHYYNNNIIEGLNYDLLLSFLTCEIEEILELVIEILINIFVCQQSTAFFIEQYDIIRRLVNVRSTETSYSVKNKAIEAISNAILCSPKHLLSSFVESGCVGELIQSLFVHNNKLVCKIIESLDILLSISVSDEQLNQIIKIDFMNDFDFSSIVELQENEDENVRMNIEKLTRNHPDLFKK